MVVCAGYQVAARNLFITISRLLYCFDCEYAGVTGPLNWLTLGWQIRY
jgi:hypothetical protein